MNKKLLSIIVMLAFSISTMAQEERSGLSIIINDVRDTIVYLYENPTDEQIIEWKNTYDNTCSFRISDKYEKYRIDGKVLYNYPSLVYLIIISSSIPEDSDKQKWFDQIPSMEEYQIIRLYQVLYKEQYSLGKIREKYDKK